MLVEALNYRLLLAAGVLPPLLVALYFALPDWNHQSRELTLVSSGDATAAFGSLEGMRTALAKDCELLAGYEREQAALREEVVRRRQAFQLGEIAASEVAEAEKAFVAALRRVVKVNTSSDSRLTGPRSQ